MTTSGPIAIPLASSSSSAPHNTTSPIQSPRSLRSVSSTNSPPPEIASNTLSMLAQFQNERSKQEAKFARLEAKAKAQEMARLQAEAESQKKDAEEEDEEGALAEAEAWADIERLSRIEAGLESASLADIAQSNDESSDSQEFSDILSVDEWHSIVKEDYQQSQFWYSTEFAYTLAKNIHSHLSTKQDSNPSIAFLCSPTAFVAFHHLYHSTFTSGENLFLMEIDERFKVASGNGFIRYDFNFPTKNLSNLQGKVDMVVIDPPFLNEKTTNLIAQSVEYLLKPQNGSILLLTGDSIGPYAAKTYPLSGQPPMVKTQLQVEHEGARLSNQFSAWANWKGAEEFGKAALN
ncbi:unnamed protein product [Sympodiomycopsis kandeliae]